MPGVGSKIYPFFAPMDVGAFLGYSLLVLTALACMKKEIWKQPYWAAFLACFVLAIVLSSYVPAFVMVNHAYFFFFDMFRGVSRVVQLASFFGGLLVAIFFAARMRAGHSVSLLVLAFAGLYLFEAYPGSPTIAQKTDFSKVAKIYDGLARDVGVTAVASYPMTYYNQNWGTAPLYEVLGQVVHQKPIAGAKDLRWYLQDNGARPLFGEIEQVGTIDNLANHGINRLVIYNRLLDQAPRINAMLQADQRLNFLGRSTVPEIECGVSLLCRSLDISVYEIKNALPQTSVPLKIPSL